MTFQTFAGAGLQATYDISFDPIRYGLNETQAAAIANAKKNQTWWDRFMDTVYLTGYQLLVLAHKIDAGSAGPNVDVVDLPAGADVTAQDPYDVETAIGAAGQSLIYSLAELAGRFNLRRFTEKAQANWVKQIKEQRRAKERALKALRALLLVYGDTAVNANQFNGFLRLISLGYGLGLVSTLTNLLDRIDQLIESMDTSDGDPEVMRIMGNSDAKRKLISLARQQFRSLDSVRRQGPAVCKWHSLVDEQLDRDGYLGADESDVADFRLGLDQGTLGGIDGLPRLSGARSASGRFGLGELHRLAEDMRDRRDGPGDERNCVSGGHRMTRGNV